MQTYLINLDRAQDRLARMHEEFGRVGLSFARFPGVDTLGWRPEELEAFFRLRPRFSPTDRLPGDAGNFLSHLQVWQAIAAGDDEFVAVFEDDVHLAADTRPLLSVTDWIPDDADIVRLESNSRMVLRGGRRLRAAPGRRIYRALTGTWGTAGYVIRKATAAALTEGPTDQHTHIDWFLFKPTRSPVAASLVRYQIAPAVCIQDHYLHGDAALMKSSVSSGVRVVPPACRRSLLASLIPHRKRVVSFRP